MREYWYTVDGDGRIFHDGSEIIDPAVLRFFVLGMQRTPDGRYLVPCQGEQNWFDAADTPLVVQRVHPHIDQGGLASVDLVLAGDYRERLEPATLQADGARLYCRVRRGALRARFGRIAVQQLGAHLAEADGNLVLTVQGRAYRIPVLAG